MEIYICLFFITVISSAAMGMRLRKKYCLPDNPELLKFHTMFVRYLILWCNIPWIVMGFGSAVGSVPTLFHYFHLSEGNPYVISWVISVIWVWGIGSYHVFFRDGAEMLVRYPDILKFAIPEPSIIKLFCLTFFGIGLIKIFIILGNFPEVSASDRLRLTATLIPFIFGNICIIQSSALAKKMSVATKVGIVLKNKGNADETEALYEKYEKMYSEHGKFTDDDYCGVGYRTIAFAGSAFIIYGFIYLLVAIRDIAGE